MAANLNDAPQTIEPYAVRIFKGLKPDVVAIQEFNYGGNSAAELRYFVDDAFGTNFVYYREPISGIPNGVISRYPFLETGSWADPEVSNRGFAWARIDLPGTNDLYVVSVHLLTSSAGERSSEANSLKALIQANFPAGSWIVVAGDFNTQSRTETCITTFNSFLSDNPIPTDSESAGKPQTNKGRTEEYDYILASHSMTNRMTNTVFASRSFARGLVFDSRVYTPLSDVSPVQEADSGLGQHMAVLKDFAIPFATTNAGSAPVINTQPRSQTNSVGANVTFSVVASGGAPLTYIWEFGSDVVSAGSASSYTVQNVSKSDEGAYVVVVTNMHGKATSDVATLTVTLPVPYITQQPQHQAAVAGSTVVFSVTANGAHPLSYQWRSNELNIAGASLTNYTIQNVQASAQAGYSVVVTNQYGAVTSSVANLAIVVPGSTGLLSGWTAGGLTNYGPSPLLPSTNSPLLSVTGLTRGPGMTTTPTAANNAWGGNGLNATSAAAAIAAGDFVTFSLSGTSGYEMSLARIDPFFYRRSSGGPPSGLLQYQVGSGAFIDVLALSFSSSSSAGAAIAPVDLSSITSLQNVPSGIPVTFRLVLYGGTSSGGNWYVYTNSTQPLDLGVYGNVRPINAPPAVPPAISNPVLAGGSFEFQITGTATSNYIVEATTNLAGNWSSVATNPAPFTFSDTNASGTPRRFFRSRVAP